MFEQLTKNEEVFLKETLSSDIRLRLDAREVTQHRPIDVKYGNSTNGLVIVNLGKTEVMAASSKKIVPPMKHRPSEGFYRFNLDFKHLQHDNENMDLLQENRLELVRCLEKVFITSRAIDTTSLCISKGKYAWAINIEISLVNYDGNLIDAVFLAALQCLKTLKLPQVRGKEDSVKILEDKPWKNINVHHMPIPVSFYFIENEDNMLIDPDVKEEKICTSRNTIFMNVFGDICGIHTNGVLSLSFEMYQECLKLAETKAKEITVIMREKLKNFENYKIDNLAQDLADMEIDDGEGDTEDVTRGKKEFVKSMKKKVQYDYDNELVDDKLVVDTMKRQKVPKLGEDSSRRGAQQYHNKRHRKQIQKEESSDSEEEAVVMKSEFK